MKLFKTLAITFILAATLTACGKTSPTQAVEIGLSDGEVTVDGVAAETSADAAVYIGHDIVYYEADRDFTYGEGTDADAHSAQSAAAHTVVHISRPGTYRLSGSMSKGQIAVDLGEDAEDDPEAVVTLILDGADITCEVAPAIIFYNVYECGSADAETASKDVDTSCAGANVIIADGSENTINGSHVARIYKPESVVLNDEGTAVEDAKKLHKYDAAFYSKMSMNVNGEDEDSGVLRINADNEGLDSELHLTVNGGCIYINAANDGINTNEDGVSVTAVNGGEVHIRVTGETGEGDGIDSNGWLVINGGTVTAEAYGASADSGIDSDMGIHIGGGTVIASGNMLDRIAESAQTYAVLNFANFPGEGTYRMKNADGDVILEKQITNSFTSLIVSCPDLVEGDYTLWYEDTQLVGSVGENGGMFGGGMRPEMGEMPEGMKPPQDFKPIDDKMPENFDPENMSPEAPSGEPPADMPEFEGKGPGGRGPGGGFGGGMPKEQTEASEIFTVKEGANYFSFVHAADT